jgi:hypothetical protein
MKSKSAPKMSPQERLLKEVVNQILEHPETWDQKCWHGCNSCGTTHCVGGWLQVKSGKPANNSTVRGDAKSALALTDYEAAWLFSGTRSLSDIYHFAEHFSCDGFNRSGYDRTGYDRAGFNRAGYDRDAYDCAGFNRDGFNRDGYDHDGYDHAGFNRDGFNRSGYDRSGPKLVPFELCLDVVSESAEREFCVANGI